MAYSVAAAICIAIPRPPFPGNIRGLHAWNACEKPPGQPLQWNNPMNTKEPGFGGSDALSNGVKKYPTIAQGVAATVATLRNGYYPGILDAMRKPRGLSYGILHDPEVQRNISTWGTGVGCISSKLGGKVTPQTTTQADALGLSIPGSGVAGGVTAAASILGKLPQYMEIAGGGIILAFGLIVAVAGSTGAAKKATDAGKSAVAVGKTVAKVAAVA